MSTHMIPCPVYLDGQSKTQKRDVRVRWGDHLEAWILEADPVYTDNMRRVIKDHTEGRRDKASVASAYKVLEAKALERGFRELRNNRPRMNRIIRDFWLEEMKFQGV